MSGSSSLRDDETSMATRAAWLHYAGGLTQAELASRSGRWPSAVLRTWH